MYSINILKMGKFFDFGVDFPVPEDVNQDNQRISDDDINKFIFGQKVKATIYKKTSDLNVFTHFCKGINEHRSIQFIPDSDLDNLFCQFLIKAVTKKGELYEPDTLNSIRNSLQRVLVSHGKMLDIRYDLKFQKSQAVLAARRKQLKKLGKGNRPNKTRALTDEEVNHLYKIPYFGADNPMSEQCTVWWTITKHFGHRARDEGRQMKFGDLKIEKELNNGAEYLVWLTERSTKTRTGERAMDHQRLFNPKAYATGDERSAVKLYRSFISHRPKTMCEDSSPLFLAVRQGIK